MNEQTLLSSSMALNAFQQWCWDHGVAHVAENLQSIHHAVHTEEYKAFAYPYIQNNAYLVAFVRYCTGDEFVRHREKVSLAVDYAIRKEADNKRALEQLEAKTAEVKRLDAAVRQSQTIIASHELDVSRVRNSYENQIKEIQDSLPVMSFVEYVSKDREKLKEIQKRLVNAVRSEIEQLEEDYSGGAIVTRASRDKVEK